MELLFWIGTILLVLAIIAHLIVAKMAWNRLRDAKSEDFLEEYYEEHTNAD